MAKRRKESLQKEEKRPLNKQSFHKLLGVFQFTLRYKTRFIIGMICLVFSSTTLLAFPYFAGKLIDVASGETWILSSISQVALALFVILAIQSVFSFFRVYLFAQVSERSMGDIRKTVFSKILTLPLRFFDEHRVGELTSRITSDVSTLQDTFSTTLAELFRQVLTLILGIAILFYVAPGLTVFMLATIPVLVLGALFFGRFIKKLSKNTQDKLASANVIVEETLQAINMVKAFTNEILEKKRYGNAIDKVVNVALKGAVYRSGFISFIIFILFGGIVAIIWYGATLVESNVMTVGDLLSFVLYTTFIGGSIAGLGDIYGQVQRAIGASERLLEVIDEQSEGNQKPYEQINLNGEIKFENVSFAYPGRKDMDIFKSLSVDIKSGQKVALVGPSGAGKSTFIQLLSRFYDNYEGEIFVDGQETRKFNLQAYRENVGIVPQEVILFGGTISENILYGNPAANHEQVVEAAKRANALEFINSFPEGFDTMVGERGVKLSGGQRQRIAIARAILKDPAILVLDEATSSLDAESETLVQEALDKLMEGRTSIVIAHRLSTIRQADNILVMKDGDIIEQGTHDQLAEKTGGLYNHLLKLQFQLS